MAVTLSCHNLSISYDGSPVLDRLEFHLEKGRFCALLGRNGSGKTTLLHCLNRILAPDAGDIRVLGQDIRTMDRNRIARSVSLVPQELTDMFPFRVLDVVVMGRAPFLSLSQRPGPADYDLANQALDSLNAGELAQRNFNRISGGERKIAFLARALVQSAPVMLLDEPTNHLDFNNQFHLLGAVSDLSRSRGISILASLHDPNMAGLFADEVIMLKQGRIMAMGATRDVMTPDNLTRLYDTPIRPVNGGRQMFLPAITPQQGQSS